MPEQEQRRRVHFTSSHEEYAAWEGEAYPEAVAVWMRAALNEAVMRATQKRDETKTGREPTELLELATQQRGKS